MSDRPTIYELIAKVMEEVRVIAKKDVNAHFNFNFRGIDTVMEHTAEAFRNHGIIGPVPELRAVHFPETKGNSNRVVAEVAYTFYGPLGDSITAVVPGEAQDGQDKASSKAMSVAYRTALVQTLHIATGERDPHAGPPVSTKLARLREEAKSVMKANEWTPEQLSEEYTVWARGADIAAADENDLEKFLTQYRPKKTMRRGEA